MQFQAHPVGMHRPFATSSARTFTTPKYIISIRLLVPRLPTHIMRCYASEYSPDASTMVAQVKASKKPIFYLSREWLAHLSDAEMKVLCEGLDEMGYVQWNDFEDNGDVVMATEDAINDMELGFRL